MSALSERGIVRWKEWIPLVTQQQRLRNLIQVIAYNIQVPGVTEKCCIKGSKLSYYYTLHLTTMSSPLYTSEKLESENPKWSEIEIESANGAANGIVIRLWMHGMGSDKVITAWGLYFSGLIYVGARLVGTDLTMLGPNTFVFHMHGGYFTGQHCFLDAHPVTPRTLTIQLDANQVKPSYSVRLLCRLHNLQQTVRNRCAASTLLKEQIMAGSINSSRLSGTAINKGRESLALRRLMSKPVQIRPQPQAILAFRKEIELLKFRLELLNQEKERGELTVKQLIKNKDNLFQENEDKSSKLSERYCSLHKEIENCKENKRQLIETKSQLSHILALLDIRKKELMSELSIIYPIKQLTNGQFTIRGVHLPNSEDFSGKDELMISVGLGFVAHLVQMIAYFLNVPTRYPICHFGSRSKIIDHIIDTIPDKDREFPLYSKGKEKLPFDYGVYLLNKNIAQLRWCCGLTTEDLRQTLQNLSALMAFERKTHQSPREWQRMRRSHVVEEEDEHTNTRTQLCVSLDHGLNKCLTLTPSRHTDSDPQDYLQTRISPINNNVGAKISQETEEQDNYAKNQICRSLDHGLDCVTTIQSHYADSDPQDYLHSAERIPFLNADTDHQHFISPIPAPPTQNKGGLEAWALPSLESKSIPQSNCTLIISKPTTSESSLCLKGDI